MARPADIVGHIPPVRVVVCGSSRLVDEIAAVVAVEQAAGHDVIAPAFTGDQPTEAQQNAWADEIVNADEVVVVVDDTYAIGPHVKGEIYNAQVCDIPVRLVNGELMTK